MEIRRDGPGQVRERDVPKLARWHKKGNREILTVVICQ